MAPETAGTPTTTTPTATCHHHHRREAVGRCVTCEEPLCRSCMNATGVGFKCGPCSGTPVDGARSPGSGAPSWLRPGAVALVLLVVVIGAAVLGGDDEQAPTIPETEAAGDAGPTSAIERRVSFVGPGDVDLGATLSLPQLAAADRSVAGVVVIPGFGPTTRDGVSPPGTIADRFYADLSRSFTDAGMVTLRYDKRGTGQSLLGPDEALAFEDMVGDAAAAVNVLADRAEVDPERIAVVGHEEGGLVALDLAATGAPVQRLVLISVPGRPLLDVLSDDFNNSGHTEEVPGLQAVVAGLLAGDGLGDQSEFPPFLRNFFPQDEQGYLEELFSLDPATLASQVDVPTLVVRGEAATGISAADTEALMGELGSQGESLAVAEAGPTLARVTRGGGADAANPMSGGHDHGAGAAPVTIERDEAALSQIASFVDFSRP